MTGLVLAGPIVDRLAGLKNAGYITLACVMNIGRPNSLLYVDYEYKCSPVGFWIPMSDTKSIKRLLGEGLKVPDIA